MPGKAARFTRKPPRPGVGQWLAGIVAAGFACLIYGYVALPDVRPLATTNPTSTAFMELRGKEARRDGKTPRRVHRWARYNRISQDLKRAVLVAEDSAFWDHDGVDYAELQKSIELDWARGQLVRGASTITQQLAKNLYLSPSKNPLRKLRELVIARRLEAELPKARILELYLNVIEWGDGIYGVESAAREYFGVPASALGPASSALLAGAIINPRVLNPARPTPRLLRRQQIILKRMGAVAPPVETPRARPPASPSDEESAVPESSVPEAPTPVAPAEPSAPNTPEQPQEPPTPVPPGAAEPK